MNTYLLIATTALRYVDALLSIHHRAGSESDVVLIWSFFVPGGATEQNAGPQTVARWSTILRRGSRRACAWYDSNYVGSFS